MESASQRNTVSLQPLVRRRHPVRILKVADREHSVCVSGDRDMRR